MSKNRMINEKFYKPKGNILLAPIVASLVIVGLLLGGVGYTVYNQNVVTKDTSDIVEQLKSMQTEMGNLKTSVETNEYVLTQYDSKEGNFGGGIVTDLQVINKTIDSTDENISNLLNTLSGGADISEESFEELLSQFLEIKQSVETINTDLGNVIENIDVQISNIQSDNTSNYNDLISQFTNVKSDLINVNNNFEANIKKQMGAFESDFDEFKNLYDSQYKDLLTKIGTNDKNLNDKIDDNNDNLNKFITKNNNDLNATLSSNNAELNSKLDESNTKLNSKLDENNSNLNNKIDENNTNLNKTLSENNVNLNKKIDENNTNITNTLSQNNVSMTSHINSKFETLNETNDERFNALESKVDSVFQSVGSGKNKLKSTITDLSTQHGLGITVESSLAYGEANYPSFEDIDKSIRLLYTRGYAKGFEAGVTRTPNIKYTYHCHETGGNVETDHSNHTNSYSQTKHGCYQIEESHHHTSSCYGGCGKSSCHEEEGWRNYEGGDWVVINRCCAHHSDWTPDCTGNHETCTASHDGHGACEAKVLICGKPEGLIGYKPNCGKVDGQIMSATIYFND